MRLLPGRNTHAAVYLLALSLLAAGIPLSRYLMSVAQIALFANWLLEGGLRQKLFRFFNDRAAWVFSSIFLLHLAGLFFTTDFDYAFKDLRTKIPLALIPLVISSSRSLTGKELRIIYQAFLGAVFLGTLVGIYQLWKGITDMRDMSPYISHIRFSLNVCLAITLLVWRIFGQGRPGADAASLPGTLLLLWFLVYLYLSQSFTAYFLLPSLALFWMIRGAVLALKGFPRLAVLAVCLALPILALFYLNRQLGRYFGDGASPAGPLAATTASGNPYTHDTADRTVVNGHRLWMYVCQEELRAGWNQRSDIPYDSVGNTGLKIRDILIRYLTSKGLKKDAASLAGLSDQEIRLIEQGVADVSETRGSPAHRRLSKVFWEYQNYLNTGDPSGHSVMMRFEYWKASLAIIRANWLTGVGTGDMNTAFAEQYRDSQSKLKPEWRRRSHNQFLSIATGFGVFGLTWFLFALIYPPVLRHRFSSFRFASFFLILVLSMLAEDTLETQDGVTFSAFFFSLLLYGDEEKSGTFG